jgi:hypothetical protein
LGLGITTTSIGGLANHMGDNLATVQLGTGRTVKSISTSSYFACVILDNDQVKCWGDNLAGVLGTGTTTSVIGRSSTGMGDNLLAVALGGSSAPSAISTIADSACVIFVDNSAKCWGECVLGVCNGDPDAGAIGDDASHMGENLLPVPFTDGEYPQSVTVGNSAGCALLNTNNVKCWGTVFAYENTIEYHGGPISVPSTVDLGTATPSPASSPTPSPTSSPTPEPTPAPTPESTGSLCEYFCTWSGMLLRLYSLPHLSLSLSPLFGFDLQVQKT